MATNKTSTEKFEHLAQIAEDITGGFVPGDTVWIMVRNIEIKTCPVCKGTGRTKAIVNNGDTYKILCPKCSGTGNTNEIHWDVEEKTIRQIGLGYEFNSANAKVCASKVSFDLGDEIRFSKDVLYRTKEEAMTALTNPLES